MTEPALRPARPTESDAQAFAHLGYMTSEELLDAMYGRYAGPYLARMFIHGRNHYGHDKASFLLVGGKIAGLVVGYTGAQYTAEAWRTTWLTLRVLRWRSLRMLAVALAYGLRGIEMASLKPRDFYVQMVALAPSFRGQGLSRALMRHAEATARDAGCTRLVLDVEAGNATAIRAYQRFGMHIVRRSPQRYPYLFTMACDLPA